MPKSARLIPVAGPVAGHADIVISGNRAVRIGRSQEAEFPIPVDPQISTIHVSLTTNDEGLVVIDQNSTNGTFVNGRRIEKKVAFDGDEVRLGQSIWRVAIEKSLRRSSHTDFSPDSGYPNASMEQGRDSWNTPRERDPYRSAPAQLDPYAAPRSNQAATGSQLELNSGDQKLIFHPNDRLTIGRTTAADIQFADLMMSSCHFLVYFEQGRWNIADCNSTNGLFCNGNRISKTDLNSGDIVRAGQTTFDVNVRRPEGVVAPPPIQSQSSANGQARVQQTPVDPLSEPQRRVIKSDSDQIPNSPVANSFESDQAIRRSIHRSRKKADDLGIPANATLKQLTGNQYSFALFNERNVIIGSSPQADIVIREDDAVADKHLNLMLTTGMLVVEDLQSRSGTYVDGERVTRALVQDGSVLQIGGCKMLFTLTADEDAIEPQPPSHRIPADNNPGSPEALHKELDFEYDEHHDHTEIGDQSATPAVVEDVNEPEIEPDQISESQPYGPDPEIEPGSEPDSQTFESPEPEVQPGAEPDLSPIEPLRPELEPGTQPEPKLPPDLKPNVPPEWNPDRFPAPEIEPDETPEMEPVGEPEVNPQSPPEIEPELAQISSEADQNAIPFVEPVADEDTFVPPPAIFQSTIVSDVYASESNAATIEQTIHSDVPLEVISSVPPISVTDVQETSPTETGHDLLLKGYTSIDTSAIEARKLKFDNAIQYVSTTLSNGLQMYQGCQAGDDPIEICRRLLHAMPGYLIDVEPIEFWHKMGQTTHEPEDWLTLASPDDASWMIPVMTKWSKDTIFLGFSRKDSENVRQTLLSVTKDQSDQHLVSLNPSRLVDFLSTAPADEVIKFFADFDAIFMEIKSSDLWALFARPDFGNILRHLQLHQKDQT